MDLFVHPLLGLGSVQGVLLAGEYVEGRRWGGAMVDSVGRMTSLD